MENSLIENMIELILSPEKSGVYLSKPEISILAMVCGFSIILQERKRMVDDLFKTIKTKQELLRVVDALIAFFDAKQKDYESVFSYFLTSKLALDANYEKCRASVKKLQEYKTEVELLDFGITTSF